MRVSYAGYVSPELVREVEPWLGRLVVDGGARFKVLRGKIQDDDPAEAEPDLEVTSVEVAPSQVGAAHKASDLQIHLRELTAMNDREANLSRGGSTCMVLIDAPVIRIRGFEGATEKSVLLRIPRDLYSNTGGLDRVAPGYVSWRTVRIEVHRLRLASHAPQVLAALEKSCTSDQASQLTADSGMASIPAYLRIDSPSND